MSWILRNKALPWAVLFLVLGVCNIRIGGTNAVARIAGLRAITENGTLNIDRYYEWTNDWAYSPNDHYYPNKAPGGVLLGLPVWCLIDLPVLHSGGLRDARGRAMPPGMIELGVLCFYMQLLPFALLTLYLCFLFREELADRRARHFFALAALFGNTAALYMSCYFGHALAALFALGGFAAWLRGRYPASSALFAASLLTDYGTACMLPFFLAATVWRERSLRPLPSMALAALPFGILWAWYHQVAFGSPFTLAIRYSNPAMIESAGHDALWGMYGVLPSATALTKLLFGPERGVLYTQPWALAILPLCLARTRLPRGTALFLAGGLCSLLWMNASFGGWHGGSVIGPRYLSVIFPSIALALALAWRDLSRPWHTLLLLGLLVSLAYKILVYPFDVIAPIENLWGYHLSLYTDGESAPYPMLALALAGFAAAGAWSWWRDRGNA